MKADYLVGRRVTSIDDPGGGDTWKWAITLEGDSRILHTGNSPKPGNEIDETVLGVALEVGQETKLQFYTGNPATLVKEIAIATGSLEILWVAGVELPEQSDPEEDRPEDPSPLRAVAAASEE
jgi:hypothetical protein